MRIIESGPARSHPLRGVASDELPASPHEHDWRLGAVLHEDGYATEEYGCAACGGVTFR